MVNKIAPKIGPNKKAGTTDISSQQHCKRHL